MLTAQEEARRIAEEKEREEKPSDYDFDGTIGREKIDLAREKEYTLREYSEKEIKAEKQMSLDEKIAFLRAEYESVQGEGYTDEERAFKIEQMRKLSVGLWGAFRYNDPEILEFMNETLRNFLSRKPDGSEDMDYDTLVNQVNSKNAIEYTSIMSAMHQNEVKNGEDFNAKFGFHDGREYIYQHTCDGEYKEVIDGLDGPTYNFSTPDIFNPNSLMLHYYNDMKVYDQQMEKLGYTTEYKFYSILKGGLWKGNSKFWNDN